MEERRKVERVKVDLRVFWEGALTRLEGSIVDLSTSGCFILTDDQVRLGELIRVEIHAPTGGVFYMWGEVIYQIPEMGFALQFTGGEDADVKFLESLVKTNLREMKRNQPSIFDKPRFSPS